MKIDATEGKGKERERERERNRPVRGYRGRPRLENQFSGFSRTKTRSRRPRKSVECTAMLSFPSFGARTHPTATICEQARITIDAFNDILVRIPSVSFFEDLARRCARGVKRTKETFVRRLFVFRRTIKNRPIKRLARLDRDYVAGRREICSAPFVYRRIIHRAGVSIATPR